MNGESLTYDVVQGNHTIAAKIDWCATPPIVFDCQAEARFTVRSNLRGLKVLFVLCYLFMPSKYLVMERAS